MTELYYFPTVRINAKIADLVIPGMHIRIDDYVYERLSRKPKGRSIARRLQNLNQELKFIIYS